MKEALQKLELLERVAEAMLRKDQENGNADDLCGIYSYIPLAEVAIEMISDYYEVQKEI